MEYLARPYPFLEVRISDISRTPALLALCAGYESGEWRARQFAEHLLEWLPEFCLKYSEIKGLGAHNAVRLLKDAANNVYTTDKFKNRGEIGEIILHAIIRQEFNTIPLVSKIYYKDSPNDTVKGFDCVHIVVDNNNIPELWLGEVKFYKDFKEATRDVHEELKIHIQNDYLRKEFIAICNKLDESHSSYSKIIDLLNKNTSLDKIFSKLVFPILITYESASINRYNSICDDFIKDIKSEIYEYYEYFNSKVTDLKIILQFITVPIGNKDKLLSHFDAELTRFR